MSTLQLNVIKQINHPRKCLNTSHSDGSIEPSGARGGIKRGSRRRGNIVQGEINQRVFFFPSIPLLHTALFYHTSIFIYIISTTPIHYFLRKSLALHTVMLLAGGDGTQ